MGGLPVSIRLNPFKFRDIPGTQVPWNSYSRILPERPSFTLDPLFHAGAYYVQDSSAMFPGHLLRGLLAEFPLDRPLRVLDLCAAPGGKSTDIAASLRLARGDGWTLVSNEVMKARARVLADNIAVWGDPRVVVTSVDPAAFAGMKAAFDIVVADVPCSGEGMFRKDPRAVAEWSEETVELCAARQKRILADVWDALKPGGYLIYSTCTYEERENDDNLEWAAARLGGDILPPQDEFSASGVVLTRSGSLLEAGKVPGEGQWAGVLRKDGLPGGRIKADLTDALLRLRPLRMGSVQGSFKGRDFIPDPDWALSLDFDRSRFPEVELDRAGALKFLHRDALVLPDAPKGYLTVTFDGLPLGFVKNLGNRCNNLYPNSRRILMDIPRI